MNSSSKIKLKFSDWVMLVFSFIGTCVFGYLMVNPEPVIQYFVLKETSGVEIGSVESASNDVRRRLRKSLTWYKVRSEEVIFEDDTIFTGPKSEIFIELDNDIKFRLGENSLVVLSVQDGTFELDLRIGNVVADVKGKKALKLKGKGEDATIYGSGVESKVSINKSKEGRLSLASLNKEFEFEVGGEKSIVEARKALKLNENFDEDTSSKPIELVEPPLGHMIWHNPKVDFKFEWDNPKNLGGLKIQVAKDEDFNRVTLEKPVKGKVFRVGNVKKESRYFWRIVQDMDGVKTPVSEHHNFQLAVLRPPFLILPRMNDFIQASQTKNGLLLALIQFQWESRLGVEKYQLQVSPDKNFSEIIINEETPSVSKNLVELPPGSYYWRVRVSAPVQASGDWPKRPSFFTVGTPEDAKVLIAEKQEKAFERQKLDRGLPNVPAFRALDPGVLGSYTIEKKIPLAPPPTQEPEKMVLLKFDPEVREREPAAIKKAIMNPPVLKWNPSPGATEYEVEIASDKEFKNVKENIRTKEPSFTWSEPDVGGFFWRVRSSRGLGKYSKFSGANRVAVGLESPKLPRVIEKEYSSKNPADYLEAGPAVPVKWKPLPMAEAYQVVVTDEKTSQKVFEQETQNTEIPVVLPKSGDYKAMVAALNKKGKRVSPFSQPTKLKFRKKLNFKAPRIAYPVNGTTVVSFGGENAANSMILDWTKVDGAKAYRLQFSKTQDFKEVFLDKRVNNDQYFVKDKVPNGTIYWRVRAEYEQIDSGWTKPRYFEIQAVE